LQEVANEEFTIAIEKELKKMELVVKPEQVKKIVQLYDSKNTRHGNMLVGTSQSGKSTIWKVLHSTMNSLSKENKKYPAVKYEYLNPKSIDGKELFGYVDSNLEWHEGVLSSMMSRLCKEESEAQRWMILDGPVDTLWI
jgi:dynein heavy chain